MNVKRKGNAGEHELAAILRAAGINAYRHDQMFIGGKGNPDVEAEVFGLRMHIEVKRVERLNVPEAVHQAVRDAAEGYFPVVAHRRNREQWLLTMPLESFLAAVKELGG